MSTACPSCGELLPDSYFESRAGLPESSQSETSASCPKCGAILPGGFLGPTLQYTPPDHDLIGRRVAHFVLIKRLGGGGFGEVWLAKDEALDRDVALKLPNSRGKEMASLLHEARTAASLQHPHIVSVHEVGTDQGQVYIASDYIAGATLRDRMSGGKLTPEQALALLIPITRALHYAHEHGVVHRDIKPANILLNAEGRPWVTDFGIAKRISDDDTKSFDGQVVGTAKYMSPEQAAGKTSQTGRRSDLYSVGVLLFEMVTGEVPFRGNMRAIMQQKQVDEPPSPRTLNPKLPRDLETVCLKCLECEPGKRYASAAEVADELERCTRGEPILARPVSQTERLWRWCKRRPAVAGLLAALFVSLSTGLAGVTFFWRAAEDNAEQTRRSLYRARMNYTGVQLSSGDIAGVQSLLEQLSADPELAEIRGFELGYYRSVVAPFQRVANHGSEVVDVAITHDGDLCASVSSDRRIRVWETQTGQEIRALGIDQGKFTSIDFSPTTGTLASGANDAFIRLWNPRQDARLVDQEKHGSQIILVRYSPNGKWLLSLGEKGGVRIWDAADLTLVSEIPLGMGAVGKDARWFANDHVAVATEAGQIRIVQVQPAVGEAATPAAVKKAWRLIGTFGVPDSDPASTTETDNRFVMRSIAVADDGAVLAAGSYHGRLAFWALPSGELLHQEATPWGRVDDLEFLKGTHIAAIAQSDGRTHFYNLDTQQEPLALNTHGRVDAALARAANGQSLLIGNADGTLLRLGLADVERLMPAVLWHQAAIEDVEFLDDGRRLLASDWDKVREQGELRLWNVVTGESQLVPLAGEPAANLIAVQPRGEVFATAGVGPSVLVRRVEGFEVVKRLPASETGAAALEFSPDGRRLAVALRTGPLHVYQSSQWEQPPAKRETRSAAIRALAFSRDSRSLAVAWEDGLVQVLDAASLAPAGGEWTLPSGPSALYFCNAETLAIGNDLGDIQLLSLSESGPPRRIRGHVGRVFSMTGLPGGEVLVSGGIDRDLKLWDVATGELIASLPGHFRRVFAVSVAPDGRMIASGGLEGDIRLWRAGEE